MRRPHLALTALVLTAGMILAGCSGQEPSATATAPTAAATPPGPTDCSTITVSQDASALPTVSGEAGTEPTVTWSGQAAPTDLTVSTLDAGDGALVSKSSFITVNYVGWQWDSTETFDSSYANGAPATFGLNGVIPGWTCGLDGHRVGDRIVMSVPADLAYGNDPSSGRPTGPLVFVIEITDVATTAGATMEGEQALAERGITVSGALGEPATIAVAPEATEPTEQEVIVLARGDGAPVTEADTLGLNVAYTSWDGTDSQSSWESGEAITTSMTQAAGLTGLVGVPAGSRVVVLNPAYTDLSQGTSQSVPAYAYVIDIETVMSAM